MARPSRIAGEVKCPRGAARQARTLLEVPRRSFKRVVNRGLLGAVPVSARQANRDLLVVAMITGVGLLLTIGLAVLFPLAANTISLAFERDLITVPLDEKNVSMTSLLVPLSQKVAGD